MKIQRIPIDLIDWPETRITARYEPEELEHLEASLRDIGQLEPIVVVKAGERWIGVDGMHRTFEAQKRGDRTIAAVVQEGDATRALLLNLATSVNKGKTHPSEVLAVIKVLLENEGMDSDAIAQATGMKRDVVERYWRIAEASPVVHRALQEGKVALGAAFEISRVPNQAAQEELLSRQILFRTPIPELRLLVDSVLESVANPPARPVNPGPRPEPVNECQGCHTNVGPRDLQPVPLCPTCYGMVYRLAQATPEPSTKPD